MDSLPLELKKIILQILDDRSKRLARATSKEWFRIIQYDTFIFYWTDLQTLEEIIDRLMQYNHPIGITFLKSRFRGDMQQILQLSRLTHATSLHLERFLALKSANEWMHLSSLTNLQYFRLRAQYPEKLLAHYRNLTKLKMKSASWRETQPFEVLSNLKSLSLVLMDREEADLLAKIPAPLKLRELSLVLVEDGAFNEEYSTTISRFQNLTKFVCRHRCPQYLLPNLEYLNYSAPSISHLDANTKLTRLTLAVEEDLLQITSQLAALTNLKDLSLTAIGDGPTIQGNFTFLTALTALETVELYFRDDLIGPQLWPYVNAPNLTQLTIAGEVVEFTENITCLAGLQELSVESTRQTQHLSHLTNLTNLQIRYNLDRDESYIRTLTKLKSLVVYGDGEPYDLEQLDIAHLTGLVYLNLNTEVTHELYDSLSTLTNLTGLVFDQPPKDSSTDLENRFTNLKHLDTVAQNSIGWFVHMAKLTNLNSLILRFIANEHHLDYLTTLTNLTRVLFTGNVTKGAVLERFAHMKHLVMVDLINRGTM